MKDRNRKSDEREREIENRAAETRDQYFTAGC